jgi:hypothetical protein
MIPLLQFQILGFILVFPHIRNREFYEYKFHLEDALGRLLRVCNWMR